MRPYLPLPNTLEPALRRPVRLIKTSFQILDLRFVAGKATLMGPEGDAAVLAVSARDQPSAGFCDGGEVAVQAEAAVPPLPKRKAQLGIESEGAELTN